MRDQAARAGLVSITITSAYLLLVACGGGGGTGEQKPATPPGSPETAAPPEKGKLISREDIQLGAVDKAMVAKGTATYELKCLSCHSLGENRIVGPGWKGILNRRAPDWIMNMIVNTEAMLETDAEAQKALEECLVRMPNQNLTFNEAREVLEYMRTL